VIADNALLGARHDLLYGGFPMRRNFLVIAFAVSVCAALFVISCGSSKPGPVQVIGAAADLAPLSGEWIGTYDSQATGRSGSITFHLTADPKGAHGDVLMVPRRQVDYDQPNGQHVPMASASSVLSIEFVQIASGEINGKIATYADPEVAGAILETHFTGRADGDWIEGTFVTYSVRSVAPLRGTWRVHRKPAA
jgi:hypothetical protein